MSLTSGSRLGRYEIIAPLGAGGMGEVYRARDTQLSRSVAIKVLRLEMAGDDSLRARFRREAEAIAALKHPHVCVLYDVSSDRDLDFLVMEHLEGETLADRIRRGPLPFDRVLRHGIEIASALEAAHRQGFIHRDLKPGNVMLTANGAKVLDFGLAKPIAGKLAAEGSVEITRTQALTTDGAILGTLGYMAPEQLEGRPADARSDLFAMGAMLSEMATGRKVFAGERQASLIAAVLTSGPPKRQPNDPLLPELFEKIVAKCLARDPDRRWQSATDLADALRWSGEALSAAPQGPPEVSAPAPPSRTGWLVAAAAASVAAVAIALLLAQTLRPAAVAPTPGPLRLSIMAPAGTTFAPRDLNGHPQFALSPDGSRIGFVAARPGEKPRLWVRSLESTGATELPGTDNANGPFWSPDGESLAFVAQGILKRVTVSGADVRQLANVAADVGSGTWNREGTILFSRGFGQGLFRVPEDGGEVQPVTELDASRQELSHRSPQFLPDGKRFLFYVGSAAPERGGVYLGSLDSAVTTQVLPSPANAVYADPGYLLYTQASQLTAQSFDPGSGELAGEPVSLGDRVVSMFGSNLLPVSVASDGTIAYWNGAPAPTELRWLDRTGRVLGRVEIAGRSLGPRLSPDATRLVVTQRSAGEDDVWSVDLASGTSSRLTFGGKSRFAIWSPDGQSLVYVSQLALYRKAASGAGQETAVPIPSGYWAIFPEDWSSGSSLLYVVNAAAGWDFGFFDMTSGEHRSIEGPGNQVYPRLSPGGNWLAYTSDQSGDWEVYVQPFPEGNGKWQVSTGGGSQPFWRSDGKELFYLDGDGYVVAVPVGGTEAFEIGRAERLFPSRQRPVLAPYRGTYAVTPDGQRFLVESLIPDADPSTITVVLDWPAALRKSINEKDD